MFPNTHFKKAKKYWYMGQLYDWSEGILHPMMHALHYGTCTFEGIRAYSTSRGPAIFRLKEHIDRFFHSAEIIKMKVPFTKEQVIEACKVIVRENELESAYIRPLLFYSYGNLGLVPKFSPVELLVGAWEWGAYLGEKARQGVDTCIVSRRRIHNSQLDLSAKLGGVYVQSMINGTEARERGYDEAIFLNLEGRVAEGPGENIFVIKNGILHTNDRSESILEGITRTSLLEIAADLGYKTKVAPITKEDLFSADEAFFCGTAVEVTSIVQVADFSENQVSGPVFAIGDGRPGPITTRIAEEYRKVVTGQNPKFEKWLTYVKD
ncbi:MAG: branched-chain amino acid transaminase [Candidatus Saccharicenans sp.]|jgi:branched-chain amino acid aminotransferase|nr:branched-chain amino acid transaminase [Candidatus Saccharicenans sp.]MDH7493213.1 branched-chain amino acid transaminase [Candidatus Saccharicenans sp.]